MFLPQGVPDPEPRSGRSPELQQAADMSDLDPAEERSAFQLPPRPFYARFTMRMRILLFAILIGSLSALVMGLAISVLLFLFAFPSGESIFPNTEYRFVPTVVRTAVSLVPYLILVAAIAAAADVLSRRSARASSQNTHTLVEAIREAAQRSNPGRFDSPDAGKEPYLKNINLEIDPREER